VRTTWLLLLLAPVALTGCSETQLSLLPAGPEVGEQAPPDEPAPTPDPEDEGPTSPWDDLDPGEMPEVHFVVAFVDPDTCPTDAGGFGLDCQVRYAVIDLNGQVLVELDLPDSWDQPRTHVLLEPGLEGRFTAVVRGPLYGHVEEVTYGEPAFQLADRWEVWEFDALDPAHQLVAIRDQLPGRVLLPATGQTVAFDYPPPTHWMQLASWSESGQLLFASNGRCAPPAELPPVQDVAALADAAPQPVGLVDLLPEQAGDAGDDVFPFVLQTAFDAAGVPALLIGLGEDCDAVSPGSGELFAWFEQGGAVALGAIDRAALSPRLAFSADEPGAALSILADGQQPTWQLHDGAGGQEGLLPADRSDLVPVALLDPVEPTFVTIGRSPETPTSVIDVVHGGERVWTIETLRFGLQPRRVYIHDLQLLSL